MQRRSRSGADAGRAARRGAPDPAHASRSVGPGRSPRSAGSRRRRWAACAGRPTTATGQEGPSPRQAAGRPRRAAAAGRRERGACPHRGGARAPAGRVPADHRQRGRRFARDRAHRAREAPRRSGTFDRPCSDSPSPKPWCSVSWHASVTGRRRSIATARSRTATRVASSWTGSKRPASTTPISGGTSGRSPAAASTRSPTRRAVAPAVWTRFAEQLEGQVCRRA